MNWGSLFSSSEKKATVRRVRTLQLDWHCDVLPQNKEFITLAARDLASKYNCDIVYIRADVHNTKSVAEMKPAAPIMAPRNNRRGVTLAPSWRNKMTLTRSIQPAPWHTTLELHQMDTDKYINAHVYAETKTVTMNGRRIEGIATGKLSQPDGEDIPANPELFPEQQRYSTKGRYRESTFVDVVLSETNVE